MNRRIRRRAVTETEESIAEDMIMMYRYHHQCNRRNNPSIKIFRLLTVATMLLAISLNQLISAFTPPPAASIQPRSTGTIFNQISNIRANQPRPRSWGLRSQYDNRDDTAEDDEDFDAPPVIDGFDLDDNESTLTEELLNGMTVQQLKQQLRLRGKKVGGNKAELIMRLLERPGSNMSDEDFYPVEAEDSVDFAREKTSKRIIEAKSRGADIVDITEFVEVEEVGRSFRSSDRKSTNDVIDVDTTDKQSDEDSPTSSGPEVWGEDAHIVEDYEGRSIIVDGLSRTIIEYKGSNDTIVQAYVVGSRDSLAKFLRGGQQQDKDEEEQETSKSTKYSSIEEEVYAIQRKRELENKRTLPREDEVEGKEDPDDPGTPYRTIERDPGDWGIWTPTGAQLSSSEVQGVLLLSDVYGPFTENTRALADKLAFECQPVVVLVPDMFRGLPWTENPTVGEDGEQRNEKGKTYEQWRAMHPERRVDVDIRAAAAVLRERYDVSSIAVWGTCYGGGRALEAASGWYHGGAESYYNDAFSKRPPPPHVDPVACIAWYPTRYDAKKLFGKDNEGFRTCEDGTDRNVAVMAVFAEHDSLPGATLEDATLLKACLDEDPRVKDAMVKVFPNQDHGFAHNLVPRRREETTDNESDDELHFIVEDGYGGTANLVDHEYSSSDAEVACLLSTAWMETYTRVFLPTVGAPVRFDEDESWSTVQMNGHLRGGKRDVRKELEEAIANFDEVEVDMRRMSQSSSEFLDEIPAGYKEIEEEREKVIRMIRERYGLTQEDDKEVLEEKLNEASEDGFLDSVMVDAYLDGEAYW